MNRTEKLTEMKLAHRKRIAEIRAFEDFTHEARERKIKEETEKHHAEIRAEEERIESSIRGDVEAAYRQAHGPGSHPKPDAATELRLARIREEVRDELEARRLDPLRGFEDAVRSGDRERAEIIGKVGARYCEGFRRVRLGELVEENMPESKRKARQKLATLEQEQQDLEVGLAIQRHARTGGAA